MAQSFPMERLRRTGGLLALAVLAGGLAILYAVVLPTMEHHPLLDANLAGAVTEPLRTGTLNLMVASAIAMVLLAPRLLPPWGSWTALAVTLLLLVDRLWLQPRLHEAWSRVDRVTGRPLEHLQQARSFADLELTLTLAVAALVLVLAYGWAQVRPAEGLGSARDSDPDEKRSAPHAGAPSQPLKTSEILG